MSILDALRVQKANQQSIAELAALPQNQIIRLAQMGQIPADVVPVVISEKARMAKEMANIRAAQQGANMPTVIEQAMQANAQERMPEDVGVATIPTGAMFDEKNFNGGGIVAFSDGGQSWSKSSTGLNVLSDELDEETPRGKTMQDIIADVRAAYHPEDVSAITPERQAYLDALKQGSISAEDARKQQLFRLAQAGLGVLAGKSPHALQNIGEGSKEALQGYMEDVKAQRTQGLAEKKAAAELADLRRAEGRQEISSALDMYGKSLDREQRERLAREKSSTLDRFAQNYANMRANAGDPRTKEQLLSEGYMIGWEQQGQALRRIEQSAATAAAAQGVQREGQDVTREGQRQNARATALREWNDMKMADPVRREYNRLATQDRENAKTGNPTNLAEEYKNGQISSATNRILGATPQSAAPRPSGGTAPASGPAPAVGTLPAAARSQLKQGVNTTFSNGQVWTLDSSGNPKRVK